jgi:pilus assembly protein CpaF
MTQGEDGSLSTIHARDSRNVFSRVATYALTGPHRMPVEASGLLTAGALDFVVHITKARLADGRVHRFVSSVREVVGWDGTQVVSSEVFATPAGALTAVPAAPISQPRADRLAAAGYSDRSWVGAR